MNTNLPQIPQQNQFIEVALHKAGRTELIKHYAQLSLDKIIENNYPTIASVSRNIGEEKVNKVVEVLVKDLCQSFNSKLKTPDITEIATELNYGILKNLSLEDVYFALRKLKTEKVMLKSLNINIILSTLNNHFNQKCEAVYQKNLQKDRQLQAKEKNVLGTHRTSESLKIKDLTNRAKQKQAVDWYLQNQTKTESKK